MSFRLSYMHYSTYIIKTQLLMSKIFTIIHNFIDIRLWVCYDDGNQAQQGLGGKKEDAFDKRLFYKTLFSLYSYFTISII